MQRLDPPGFLEFSCVRQRDSFIRPPTVRYMSTSCGQPCGLSVGRSGDGQVSESTDVWTQVTLSLRSQLAESVWFSTFQDVSPLESDSDTLRLLAPSAYVRDRILTRYLPLVTAALEDANEGHRHVEIDVRPARPSSSVDTPSVDDRGPTPRRRATGPRTLRTAFAAARRSGTESPLHVRDVRQGRVQPVRPRRRPARRRDTGSQLQPAVHLRSAGLGKTHLLHAIGHYVHSNYQHHEVATSRPRRS